MSLGSAIRAGAAFIEIGARDKVAGTLRKIEARLNTFAAGVSTLGKTLLGVSAGILAPLAASVKLFAGVGDALDKMSMRTGVAASSLAEMKFAAEQSGASLDDVERGLFGLSRAYESATRGSKSQVEAFKRLGISMNDLRGKTPEEQFEMVAAGLSKIEDASMRGATAQQLLGRAGRQLLPMFADMAALRQEARDLGLVPSDKAVKDAAKVTDAMNRIRRTIEATVFEIGAALAPTVLSLAKSFVAMVVQVQGWVKENAPLIRTIAQVGAVIGLVGGALVGFGAILSLTATAFGALASIAAGVGAAVAAIVSPTGLVIAGLVLLTRHLLTSTDAGRRLTSFLLGEFGKLLDWAKFVFGGIRDALEAGDLELAARVLWAGLKVAWQTGLNAIQGLWLDSKNWFLDVWDDLMVGLKDALRETSKQLVAIWKQTSTSIAETLTKNSMFAQLFGIDEERQRFEELERKRQENIARMGLDAKPETSFDDTLTDSINNSIGNTFNPIEGAVEDLTKPTTGDPAAARRRAAEEAIAASEAELAKANAELAAAVGEARKARDEARAAGPLGGDPGAFAFDPDALEEAVAQSTAVGTFSAAAAARFQPPANDLETRRTEALERLVKIDEDLLRETRDFTAIA